MTALLSAILFGATSCDNNLVYEDEGDCTPRVQFVFKKHRQALQSMEGREHDAFYSVVGSVHLFIYNAETGELVFERIENTDRLKSASELNIGNNSDKCYMSVNIAPGKYRMVAWCGLDENDQNNAFYLNEGDTRAGYAECSVKRSGQTGQPIHTEKYEGLYHGIVREVEIGYHPNAQIIPMELTKDNNDIAVWVQHTSKTFSEGDYEVVYTDANGTMRFEDNAMASDTPLEYHPYATSLLATDTEYNGDKMKTGALVAHISTSRLMEAHKDDAKIEVRTKDGQTVFSIPFIKYVLELQTFTQNGQYYLDCEDTYNCSFYLTGESGTWMPAQIIINNWVKVPDQISPI